MFQKPWKLKLIWSVTNDGLITCDGLTKYMYLQQKKCN